MRAPFRTWTSWTARMLPLAALAGVVGCAGTKKIDLLESRLRHQEDMISRYQAQLERAQTELEIARRESASLRTHLAEQPPGTAPRDELDISLRATRIEFSTLMTGGLNLDGEPGDDALSVVLIPEGPDGELVRVSGTVEIEAFDLSHPQGAVRIGYWVFDPNESQRSWHKGVIQSGYQFGLPWRDLPQAEKILLHGRIVALDGRQFDTTHTIRIEPPPSHVRAAAASSRMPDPSFDRSPTDRAPARTASTGAVDATPHRWGNSFDADVPPPIQDADDAEEDDWFREARPQGPSVPTSDARTDATMPYLR
ncbi:MAG: hypothetical protein KF861_10400 [Planctomycetaceae bacterium]|nr:hypothetical protein [Planctomycetaceae bacterium]